jgi:FKBP-type peptidyl-prolyl cis-trans isomerase
MTSPRVAVLAALALIAPAFAQQAKAPAEPAAKKTAAPQTKSSGAATSPAAKSTAPAKSAKGAPGKSAAAKSAPAPNPRLDTSKDKFSYSYGAMVGQNIKSQNLDLDMDLFLRGFRDSLGGAATLLTPQEMNDVLNKAQQEFRARQQEQQKIIGEKNKREGEAFLAQNKGRSGVVTLPSGLQYEELTPGAGATPKSTDTVTTHYRGTLIDGTEFDSSYKRGQPASFAVTGVIKGWTEALQLMKVGAKWKLYIPSHLAYGEQQRGQLITPNSTLIFDIELLSIKEPTPPPQPVTPAPTTPPPAQKPPL